METLFAYSREEWRDWLETHFDKQKEIWLVFPKKNSEKQRIVYNDAVEEALCFGWIDSTVRTLDEFNFMQKFSRRNRKSSYSQPNKERIKWLHKHGLLHPSVEEMVQKIINEEYKLPNDILEMLQSDAVVWNNFQKMSEGYKRIRIAYVDDARKRPEIFKQRLKNFIKKTRDNKHIAGFGGIEKYY